MGSEVIVGFFSRPGMASCRVPVCVCETEHAHQLGQGVAVGHGSRPKTVANPIKNSLKFTSLEYTKLQVQLQVFICPHTTQPELATS